MLQSDLGVSLRKLGILFGLSKIMLFLCGPIHGVSKAMNIPQGSIAPFDKPSAKCSWIKTTELQQPTVVYAYIWCGVWSCALDIS